MGVGEGGYWQIIFYECGLFYPVSPFHLNIVHLHRGKILLIKCMVGGSTYTTHILNPGNLKWNISLVPVDVQSPGHSLLTWLIVFDHSSTPPAHQTPVGMRVGSWTPPGCDSWLHTWSVGRHSLSPVPSIMYIHNILHTNFQ